jgi:signal transduction histidine kinase
MTRQEQWRGIRGVARDITERLYTQAQLRQAQQEEQLRHTQKMEAIGTLAGGIAHDFNNILNAILGYTELTLYEISKSTKARRNLQEVLTAGKRAKELVQQILTFSRNGTQERKPVHLHLVVKEVLKLLRASLPTTIGIFQDISEDTGTVLADPTQMHQVLMNLCVNAEYAMREKGGILKVRLDAVQVDAVFAAQNPPLHPGAHGEHSVILTFPAAAVDAVQTPGPGCRYTSHSAALTSDCCCRHTTTLPSA